MNYTKTRRLFLKLFIGFLALSAVIAIVSVLCGEFGKIQIKILVTTFTISAASICSMSCAAFIEKKNKTIGLAGIILSGMAATFLISGIWAEIDAQTYWKITITLIVLAISLAHGFLLILPELDERHKWTQALSSFSIAFLAAQIIAAVCFEVTNTDYYRLLAIVSILVVLETLVIPILMKLKKGPETKDKLVLQRIEPDIFISSDGKRYKLIELKDEYES